MTLVFCALFVFYFNCYVGILRTICFILSLKCWCFAHYLFSTFTNVLLFCALFVFYFNYYVGVLRPFFTFINTLVFCALFVLYFNCYFFFGHYLLSTFTITLVYFALFVFYFNYYVGVLRIICFILLLIRWRIGHYLFST